MAAADFIPDPFGLAVRTIADTGSKVVAALKDADANFDAATHLGERIADFVKRIQGTISDLARNQDTRISKVDLELLDGLRAFQRCVDLSRTEVLNLLML